MQEGYEFNIKSIKEILEEAKKNHNQKPFFTRIFDRLGRRMIKIMKKLQLNYMIMDYLLKRI